MDAVMLLSIQVCVAITFHDAVRVEDNGNVWWQQKNAAPSINKTCSLT